MAKEKIVIFDREKPSTDDAGGLSSLYLVDRKRNKNHEEKEILMPDKKTKMILPDDAIARTDTLRINKTFRLKKGVYRLVGREGSNLVLLPKKLADTSTLMLNNSQMTTIINRASLVRIAKGALGGLGENWVYLVLAAMAGVGMGWILYPQFNHAPITTAIEYCTKLANGTMFPRSCPPQVA